RGLLPLLEACTRIARNVELLTSRRFAFTMPLRLTGRLGCCRSCRLRRGERSLTQLGFATLACFLQQACVLFGESPGFFLGTGLQFGLFRLATTALRLERF